MKPENVLILPGWQNSGPDHWQSRWEAQHGHRRVDQHDWMTPRRGDWIARLEDVILGIDGPVVLVAHSLGCILTAAWAEVSRSTDRVQGALLVAPGDPEREELRGVLPSWAPIVRQRLPFPSVLVGSRNDPYCTFEKAQSLSESWGARFVDCGERGHINAESGLGDWPEGLALLTTLMDSLQSRVHKTRSEALRDLLELRRSPQSVGDKLQVFPWDCNDPAIPLLSKHVVAVLERFLSGELSPEQVETWANAIEGRDDIEYSPEHAIGQAIHALANPMLTEPLESQIAQAWLTKLSRDAAN